MMWFTCLLLAALAAAARLPAAPRAARSHVRLLALRGGELDDVLPPAEPPSDMRPMEDAADMEEALAEAGTRLVVVDFFGPTCKPCKIIAPILKKLAAKHRPKPGNDSSGVLFYQVDVDGARAFAEEQGIKSMPTIKFFRNGKLVHTIIGANVAAITQFIKRETMHPLLRALSGERVAAAAIASYFVWSFSLSRSGGGAMLS